MFVNVAEATKRMLKMLKSWSQIRVVCTLRVYQGEVYNESLRRNVVSYTDREVIGISPGHLHALASLGQGLPSERDDVDVVFLAEDCLDGRVTIRDKVKIDDTEYAIEDVEPYLGVAYGLSLKGES